MLDIFRPLLTAEGLVSVVSLTALEIVLGIDNIVFIAIVSERLEPGRRPLLRRLGVGLALGMRLGLLFTLSFLMGFTRPVVTVLGQGFSGRDLILLAGGLFLIAKSSHELFRNVETAPHGEAAGAPAAAGSGKAPEVAAEGGARFSLLLVQILVLDVVFSLDSVITAVGMARQIVVMAVAMVTAVLVMLLAANVVSDFISRHPSMKVLALSFLMMIGVLLIADAFDKHISKGYVYFAMVYALGIELINIRRNRTRRADPPPAT